MDFFACFGFKNRRSFSLPISLGRRPDLTCSDIVRLTVFYIKIDLAYMVT